MTTLSDPQRRALAARLAAAEGALQVLEAYARLAGQRAPAAASAVRELTGTVEKFSSVCDAVFQELALPAAMRDWCSAVAEQLTRLEAATEDLHVPAGDNVAVTRAARVGLADVRLAIDQLARELQNVGSERERVR